MALRNNDAFEMSDVSQEEYGFFNAKYIDGKYQPSYDSQQFSEYFALFVGNGVFMSPANQLMVKEVPDTQGMSVIVEPGWAFINGRWYHNKRQLTLTVPRNDGIATRTDGVYITYDIQNDTITAKYVSGRTTPQRTDLVYELMLAQVSVAQGVTSITNTNITDKRGDSTVCGFVKGLLEVVDINELMTQIRSVFDDWMEDIGQEWSAKIDEFNIWMNQQESDFEEWKRITNSNFNDYFNAKFSEVNMWFESIKGQLEGDVATSLTQRMNDLEARYNGMETSIEQITKDVAALAFDIEQQGIIIQAEMEQFSVDTIDSEDAVIIIAGTFGNNSVYV